MHRARPASDRLGRVEVTLEQAFLVEHEALRLAVGVNRVREGHLEHVPVALLEPVAVAKQHEGNRDVVPERIAREVEEVEIVPAELSAHSAEERPWILTLHDDAPIVGLDPYPTGV